jgi:hypothetical protein
MLEKRAFPRVSPNGTTVGGAGPSHACPRKLATWLKLSADHLDVRGLSVFHRCPETALNVDIPTETRPERVLNGFDERPDTAQTPSDEAVA